MTFVWLAIFLFLTVAAAVYDFTSLRIPNWICISIVVLFIPKFLISGAEYPLMMHLGAGGLLLAIGFVAFAFNVFGAGDAKLLAAVSLWLGLPNLLLFLVMASFVGGILGLVVLVLRRIDSYMVAVLPSVVLSKLPSFVYGHGPIPYGVAISGGVVLTVLLGYAGFGGMTLIAPQ